MPTAAAKNRKIITDKLVVEKTGRTMAEWFAVLDAKGAKYLDSQGIYALVNSIDGLKELGEWNCGLLSTSYQWDRGLRGRGEKADGYEISVSKTVGVPIGLLYAAFVDVDLRAKWLADKITITRSTENRSVRAAWADGTRLSIDLYPKGDAKSQVVVQHLKLPDAEAAAAMKTYWAEALDRLKEIVELR